MNKKKLMKLYKTKEGHSYFIAKRVPKKKNSFRGKGYK